MSYRQMMFTGNFFPPDIPAFFPQPYTFGTPTAPTDSPHSNEQLIELVTTEPSVD